MSDSTDGQCPTCSTTDWSARVTGSGSWCFDPWHDRYEWTDDDRGALDIGNPDTWNPNGPFVGAFHEAAAGDLTPLADALADARTRPTPTAAWCEMDLIGGSRESSHARPRWPADIEWGVLFGAFLLALVGAEAVDGTFGTDGPVTGVVCIVTAALTALFVAARLVFADPPPDDD